MAEPIAVPHVAAHLPPSSRTGRRHSKQHIYDLISRGVLTVVCSRRMLGVSGVVQHVRASDVQRLHDKLVAEAARRHKATRKVQAA